MPDRTCTRCRRRGVIPSFQFVKFNLVRHILCEDCWRHFLAWFSAVQPTFDRAA